ncbi:MAG: AAA family ATPase [Oscillospiraceae bacterium]
MRAAIDGAAARGCASPEALTARAEYLLEQAVPEPIILRVFAEMFSCRNTPELVPDPPVRYVQADGFGALTRCLAYRLTGMHLRLVGSKGCGKNTLIQTVDWLLNVPQYRMQGNAELDKLDLLGGPTIENGTMRYRLSDMLRYLAAGADVVLDEGNTIKPECADVLHSADRRRAPDPGARLRARADAPALGVHDHDERGLCRHELHERGDDRPLHAHPHRRAGEHRRCAAPRRARGERRQPEYLRLCLLCHPRPHPQRRRARAGRDDDPRLY